MEGSGGWPGLSLRGPGFYETAAGDRPKDAGVLGLDIGGANLKAAHVNGSARTRPFPLWKQPGRLPGELRLLLDDPASFDLLAVTMTAELCDCFETKHAGVAAVLDAVESVAGSQRVLVWQNDGNFVPVAVTRRDSLKTASANWLALATFVGRYYPEGAAILIDIGSTTTDIIPIMNGLPVPLGRTDLERLAANELI